MSKKRKKKIIFLTCALITSIILFITVCVLFLDKDKIKEENKPELSSELSSMITEESSMIEEKGETYSITGENGIRVFNVDEIKTDYKNYFVNYNEKETEKFFKILEGILVSSKYNISGIEGTVVDFRELWDEGFGDITVLTDTNELYCGNVEFNNNTKKTDISFLKLDTTIKIERLIGPYYYGVADIVVPINRVYGVSTDDKIYQITYEYDNDTDFRYVLEKKDDSIFSFAELKAKLDKDGYVSLYMNSAKSFRTFNSLEAKEIIEIINGDYYIITKDDYLYKIKIEDEDSSLDSSYELVNDNKIMEFEGYKKVDADNDTEDSFDDGYSTTKEIKFTFEK